MRTNKNMSSLLLGLLLFLIPCIGYGQKNEIKIRYIGNCGLHITDGTTHIYTDFPYKSGAHHYDKYDDSEIDSLKENAIFDRRPEQLSVAEFIGLTKLIANDTV